MILCENHPDEPALFKISRREGRFVQKPHILCGTCALEFIATNALVAQRIEHGISNSGAEGSNPSGGAIP